MIDNLGEMHWVARRVHPILPCMKLYWDGFGLSYIHLSQAIRLPRAQTSADILQYPTTEENPVNSATSCSSAVLFMQSTASATE